MASGILYAKGLGGGVLGLVVNNGVVTVDHSVKEHLITTVEGNPKVETMACGLRVFSLFTRIKDSAKGRSNRRQRRIGDNCPLLYALKGKDGLMTNVASIRLLADSAYKILDQIAKETTADTVIYMPSAYGLSKIVGKRCAQVLGAELAMEVFVKPSKLDAYDMLLRAEKNGEISTAEKRKVDYRLKQSEGFSLKDIPVQHRVHFIPLCLNQGFEGVIQGKVVLVDDLLATGRTLSVAASLVRNMENVSSVEAVCLFSRV